MKQNKLTIIFFSLLVALAFTACNDDLLEKDPPRSGSGWVGG